MSSDGISPQNYMEPIDCSSQELTKENFFDSAHRARIAGLQRGAELLFRQITTASLKKQKEVQGGDGDSSVVSTRLFQSGFSVEAKEKPEEALLRMAEAFAKEDNSKRSLKYWAKMIERFSALAQREDQIYNAYGANEENTSDQRDVTGQAAETQRGLLRYNIPGELAEAVWFVKLDPLEQEYFKSLRNRCFKKESSLMYRTALANYPFPSTYPYTIVPANSYTLTVTIPASEIDDSAGGGSDTDSDDNESDDTDASADPNREASVGDKKVFEVEISHIAPELATTDAGDSGEDAQAQNQQYPVVLRRLGLPCLKKTSQETKVLLCDYFSAQLGSMQERYRARGELLGIDRNVNQDNNDESASNEAVVSKMPVYALSLVTTVPGIETGLAPNDDRYFEQLKALEGDNSFSSVEFKCNRAPIHTREYEFEWDAALRYERESDFIKDARKEIDSISLEGEDVPEERAIVKRQLEEALRLYEAMHKRYYRWRRLVDRDNTPAHMAALQNIICHLLGWPCVCNCKSSKDRTGLVYTLMLAELAHYQECQTFSADMYHVARLEDQSNNRPNEEYHKRCLREAYLTQTKIAQLNTAGTAGLKTETSREPMYMMPLVHVAQTACSMAHFNLKCGGNSPVGMIRVVLSFVINLALGLLKGIYKLFASIKSPTHPGTPPILREALKHNGLTHDDYRKVAKINNVAKKVPTRQHKEKENNNQPFSYRGFCFGCR